MYYRGYSAKGTNFIDSTSVSETIAKISSGTEPKNKAIFSNAKQVMGTNFPSVWANIANNQNTTTTINTSSNYNSIHIRVCVQIIVVLHIDMSGFQVEHLVIIRMMLICISMKLLGE